jgi:hypothetical protein
MNRQLEGVPDHRSEGYRAWANGIGCLASPEFRPIELTEISQMASGGMSSSRQS